MRVLRARGKRTDPGDEARSAVRFYHGTTRPGLKALVPGPGERVCLAVGRALAALCIWDFDRNPCKWMGYRIPDGKVTSIEYFPGALEKFRVSGYFYSCAGDFPLNDKRGLAAGVEGPVTPDGCEEIEDVLDFLLAREREGELDIRRFEALAGADHAYVRETVARLTVNLDLKNHPENPYHAFVRDRFPDVWDQSSFSR